MARGVVVEYERGIWKAFQTGEYLKAGLFPLIGVYDVFFAHPIAAKYYDGIFVSGFGFAASYYGLPDVGFITWSDMVGFVQRVRAILPEPPHDC